MELINSTHESLIEAGWRYLGESCGCNGSAKKKQYKRNTGLVTNTININQRALTLQYNRNPSKRLEDVTPTDYL